MPSDPRIRAAMAALVKTLASPTKIREALGVLTAGAVDAIPGADYASISIRHASGELETVASTHPVVSDIDACQYRLQEGPCYDAVTDESFTAVFDLERDARWPNYGPAAAKMGLHAQLAVLLTDDRRERSALNLYAAQPHMFNNDSIDMAEMFASHAAVAMGLVRTVETLGEAIGTRQVIGQAAGIIMERYQIDEERAFAFLVRISQDSNVKLREVAAEFVTGLNGRTRQQSVDPASS
jgi:GAF domain-containing protein